MPGGSPELIRAHAGYMELAKDIANDKLNDELFPILQKHFPKTPIKARQWKPLRVNFRGPSDLGMKLQMDDFVRIILSDDRLVDLVRQIVMQSLGEAMFRQTELQKTPFIAAILRDLISEEPTLDATTSQYS